MSVRWRTRDAKRRPGRSAGRRGRIRRAILVWASLPAGAFAAPSTIPTYDYEQVCDAADADPSACAAAERGHLGHVQFLWKGLSEQSRAACIRRWPRATSARYAALAACVDGFWFRDQLPSPPAGPVSIGSGERGAPAARTGPGMAPDRALADWSRTMFAPVSLRRDAEPRGATDPVGSGGAALIAALSCARRPSAAEVLLSLKADGMIEAEASEYPAGLSYFRTRTAGFVLDGLRVAAVFGFDPAGRLFFRTKPGTDPSPTLGITTTDAPDVIESWRRSHGFETLSLTNTRARLAGGRDLICARRD